MMVHAERNAEICKLYTEGTTIRALAAQFDISRQRIRQVIRAGGVWQRSKTRPIFVGIDVTQETKDKLKDLADSRQTSMSKLASDAINAMLNGEIMDKKKLTELLSKEFLAQAFEDISNALPSNMDHQTRADNKLRLLQEKLVERLTTA